MAIIEFYVFGILYLKSSTHCNNDVVKKVPTTHSIIGLLTPSSTWYPSHVDCIICSNGLHGLQSISRSLLDRIAWRVPYKCSRLTAGSELSAFQAWLPRRTIDRASKYDVCLRTLQKLLF